jgi:hypothetical protein
MTKQASSNFKALALLFRQTNICAFLVVYVRKTIIYYRYVCCSRNIHPSLIWVGHGEQRGPSKEFRTVQVQ